MAMMLSFSSYVWGQGPYNPNITALNPPNLGAGNNCGNLGQNLFPFGNFDNVSYSCGGGIGNGNLSSQSTQASFCGLDVCCMGWVTTFPLNSLAEITPDDPEYGNGDTGCDLTDGIGWFPKSGNKAVGLVTTHVLMEAVRMPLYNDLHLIPGLTYRLRFWVNELCGPLRLGNIRPKINIFASETPITGSSNIQPAIPSNINHLPSQFTCTGTGINQTIKAFPIGSVEIQPGNGVPDFQSYEIQFTVPQNFTGNAKELVFYISNENIGNLTRFSVVMDDFELYVPQNPLNLQAFVDYICRDQWHINLEGTDYGNPPYQIHAILNNSYNSCTTQITTTQNNFYLNSCYLTTGNNNIQIQLTDACGKQQNFNINYPNFQSKTCCNDPDYTFDYLNIPTVATTFTNKKIRFIGNININAHLTFYNCIIYMGNHATLNVFDNLTLRNTTITICPDENYMWDAIIMKGNGNKIITIQNNNNLTSNYIEHALRGIVIEGNNRIVANRAVFRKNLFSIVNYANNDLAIQRSLFKAGNLNANNQNVTYSQAGIINYGHNVIIGPIFGNNNGNRFEDFSALYTEAILQKGATNFLVTNNNFKNCYRGIHGIDATGSCSNNTFNSNIPFTIGIELLNSYLNTQNNRFNDMSIGIAAQGLGIFRLDSDNHQRMKIAGVYILGEAIQAEIKNCTFQTNVPSNALGIGIFETDFANAVPKAVKIFDNTMSGVGTGIHLFQLNKPEIYQDTIHLSGLQSPYPNFARGAINLIHCTHPVVYKNILSSQFSNSNSQTHGIFAEETDNLIAHNNTFRARHHNGISLVGISVAGPKYFCNNFDRINTAMVFSGNGNSLVGNNFFWQQLPTMNRFRNVIVHSLTSGNTILSNANGPLAFYYYRNLTSGGWTEYPSNNQGIFKLIPQLTSVTPNFTCSSQSGNKALNYEVAIQPIITDKDWENKLKLMAEILADTTLLQDSIYAQFYQAHQNDNIYRFALAQKYAVTDTALSNQILNNTVPILPVEQRYKKIKQLVRKKQWTSQDSLDVQQIAHQPFEAGVHKYLAAFVELLKNPDPQQHAGLWVPAIPNYSEQAQKPSTVTFLDEELYNTAVIYPNPTDGILNIEGIEWNYAEIYDMLGKKLKICQNYVDISDLNDGVYTMKLYNETGLVLVHKIVKQ